MTAAPPTTTAAPFVARGQLYDLTGPTATRPAGVVFHLPGSQYQLHLRLEGTLSAAVGTRISGVITAAARRVDITGQGGRFVEPVMGRPRRVQGSVVSADTAANTITVNCAAAAAVDGPSLPVVVKLTDPRQQAADFPIGSLVGFDALDGATFSPTF